MWIPYPPPPLPVIIGFWAKNKIYKLLLVVLELVPLDEKKFEATLKKQDLGTSEGLFSSALSLKLKEKKKKQEWKRIHYNWKSRWKQNKVKEATEKETKRHERKEKK